MKRLTTLLLLTASNAIYSQVKPTASAGVRYGNTGLINTFTAGVQFNENIQTKAFINTSKTLHWGCEINYSPTGYDVPFFVSIGIQSGFYGKNIGVGFPQLEQGLNFKWFKPSLVLSPNFMEVRANFILN